MKHTSRLAVALFALSLVACGPNGDGEEQVEIIDDDNDPQRDTGTSSPDSTVADTGMTPDTGTSSPDTGMMPDTSTQPDTGQPLPGLPVLGDGEDSLDAVNVETIVKSDAGLNGPRDLAFNPESPDQLWIVNRGDHSAVVVSDTGTDDQSATKYDGINSRHFMAKPAALAFGAPGRMATAQQENEKTQPSTPTNFMGTTLWTTDLNTFDAGHHGHIDMLHNSPLSSGIAWEKDNIYWVFDGAHGAITMYDFNMDHGPGGTDHTDGIVRRYVDGKLSIKEKTVAHVDLDRDSGLLYIADTGNQRIAVLDTNTGEEGKLIFPNYDQSDQKFVRNADLSTLVEGSDMGLQDPAGLELYDGHLYVTDNKTSTVYAFTTEGDLVDKLDLSDHIAEGAAMGMAFDQDGQLYVANAGENTILKISPLAD